MWNFTVADVTCFCSLSSAANACRATILGTVCLKVMAVGPAYPLEIVSTMWTQAARLRYVCSCSFSAGLASGSQVYIHSVSEQDQNTWLSHIDYMCLCCQQTFLCTCVFNLGLMIAIKCYNSNLIIGLYESQDSSVGIVTANGLDGQGSIPSRRKRFFSTPQHPDQLWAPPSLSPMGTRGSLLGGKAARAWSQPLTSI
jgi:hypothetical protein